MTNPFQQVPCDHFLNYLNDCPKQYEQMDEDYSIEGDWILKQAHDQPKEQNPFFDEGSFGHHSSALAAQHSQPQRSQTQFGRDLLQNLKKQKEEEIIKNNKELFQANQSKSIYLTKISQLVETPKPPSKPKTRQKVIVDSDSSDYGNGKSKLAKNRESARNSRKRKKIYIELLENKVQELTNKLDEVQKSHALIVSRSQQLEQMIYDYNLSIKNLSNLQSVSQLQDEFGAASPKRWAICTDLINCLIDATIPYELKRIVNSATKGIDFFCEPLFSAASHLLLRDKIREEANQLQIATQQFGQFYDRVREKVFNIERLKWEVLQAVGLQQYIEYLNS